MTQYSWRDCGSSTSRGRWSGCGQRLVVHPAEHQHLAGVVLLHDRGDQAVGVALEARGDGGVERRSVSPGHPVPARRRQRGPLLGDPGRVQPAVDAAGSRDQRRRAGRAATTRPRSTTTTSSAFSAVDSRCAMVTEVRPRISRSRARPIRISSGRVDGAGGLVEDQQVGVGEVGAEQRDELPLAGRQRLAALADPGVEAARQAGRASRPRPSSVDARRAISSSVASSRP